MNRQRGLIIFIFLNCWFCAIAQSQPSWITHLPKPENPTYYYRVTQAEERTYEKAYARAFAMAILESSWKMGVAVEARNDIAVIEKGITDSISIRQHTSKIPLNKVCEWHTKPVTSDKIKLYVLWQVAVAGNIEPDFGFFEHCK